MALPRLRYPTLSAPNANLLTRTNWTTLIGANAAVRGWVSPDNSRITATSNRVSAITDRAAAEINYAQATSGKQPLLVADVQAGRNALRFANTRGDYISATGAITTGGDMGAVVVFRATPWTPGTSPARMILHIGTVATSVFRMSYNSAENLSVYMSGSSGTIASNTASGFITGQWLIGVIGYDSTTKTIYMSVDGGITFPYAQTNAAFTPPTVGTVTLGNDDVGTANQTMEGDILTAIPLSLNPQAGANAALMASIRDHISNRLLLPS